VVRNLANHVGQVVTVSGWRYSERKIHFLQVRDGSGIVQGVMGKGDVSEDTFSLCGTLPYERARFRLGETL